MSPIFCDNNSEKYFVWEISTRIQNSDSIHNDEDFFTDMQKFNCHKNTDETIFCIFWSAAAWLIDMDTGTGAHQRRHAVFDGETTNNVLYAPNVLLV